MNPVPQQGLDLAMALLNVLRNLLPFKTSPLRAYKDHEKTPGKEKGMKRMHFEFIGLLTSCVRKETIVIHLIDISGSSV